jgi:hypothetical protein
MQYIWFEEYDVSTGMSSDKPMSMDKCWWMVRAGRTELNRWTDVEGTYGGNDNGQ